MTQDLPGVTHRTVRAGELDVHVAEAGPPDAPMILMLHGFPEHWWSWRHQLVALQDRFRVVAPDLRGYGETSDPGTGYRLDTLAADIATLIHALGREQVVLVGHDWGGVIAWAVAALHPEVVARLVVLDAPHMAGYVDGIWRHPRQLVRSWYIAMFQVPGLFERAFRRDPDGQMARMLKSAAGRRDVFTPDVTHLFAEAIAAPGRLEAALGYYRALPGFMRRLGRLRGPLDMPVLVLWGRRDPALGPELVDASLHYCKGSKEVRWFDEAGHWLQQEEPEAVSAALAAFARTP